MHANKCNFTCFRNAAIVEIQNPVPPSASPPQQQFAKRPPEGNRLVPRNEVGKSVSLVNFSIYSPTLQFLAHHATASAAYWDHFSLSSSKYWCAHSAQTVQDRPLVCFETKKRMCSWQFWPHTLTKTPQNVGGIIDQPKVAIGNAAKRWQMEQKFMPALGVCFWWCNFQPH